MARKSTKKKSKSARKRSKDSPTWRERLADLNPAYYWPWLRPAGITVVIAALLGVFWWGTPKLQLRVAEAAVIDPATITLTFDAVPAWVTPELMLRLEQDARRELTGAPFGRDDLVAVRNIMLESGWFESVTQVRRTSPLDVEISATFVTRYAAVRDEGRDRVIDPAGRLLPMHYATDYPHGLIVIQNAMRRRPERLNEVWPGPDIQDALALIAVLEPKPWCNQIAIIDVDRASENILTVMTNIGSEIIWGSVPGREGPLEMQADMKISYLDRAYYDSGINRIDWNHKGRWHFLANTMTKGDATQ